MTRRIMRAFKVREISGVDDPAQVHARVSIMKRNNGEIEMTDAELEAKITKAVGTATADLTAKLEKANAFAKLNDAQKNFYGDLSDADKEKFLVAKSTEQDEWMARVGKANEGIKKFAGPEFDAAVAAAVEKRGSDETLTVGEATIRKSQVGEASFNLMKAQNDEIAKQRDANELATLEKRAGTELGHMPGEPLAKAKVLRAIGKMAKEDAETLTTLLKAGDKAMADILKAKGRDGGGGDGDDAEGKLNKLAETHATEKKISKAAAYDAVLQTDEGKRLYEESRNAKAAA